MAMDWTDFDADNQATLELNLVTHKGRRPRAPVAHGRQGIEVKTQRNDFEDLCLCRLKALLPEDVAVTILADRGFGDVKLFEFLDRLGFGYVIRFRGNVQVAAADGETRLAADSVGKGGTGAPAARRQGHGRPPQGRRGGLRPRHGHERGVASGRQRRKFERGPDRQTLRQAVDDRAWVPGCKNLRFGMGLSALRIGDPQRRDRLLMLNALAILLLTLLGAAGESLGMDRLLRTSTVKRRVHSLFRQGCLLYGLIPNMPEQKLRPLVAKYEELLRQNRVFTETFGLA